jgi:hypothetical protein
LWIETVPNFGNGNRGHLDPRHLFANQPEYAFLAGGAPGLSVMGYGKGRASTKPGTNKTQTNDLIDIYTNKANDRQCACVCFADTRSNSG